MKSRYKKEDDKYILKDIERIKTEVQPMDTSVLWPC
jgi:hypothetical protein